MQISTAKVKHALNVFTLVWTQIRGHLTNAVGFPCKLKKKSLIINFQGLPNTWLYYSNYAIKLLINWLIMVNVNKSLQKHYSITKDHHVFQYISLQLTVTCESLQLDRS